MSFLRDEFARIRSELEGHVEARWRSLTAVSIWSLSQLVRGTVTIIDREVRWDPEWEHETAFMTGALTLELFAEPECESALNREAIGPVVGRVSFVSPSGGPPASGLHAGSFRWGPESEITGTLRGITEHTSTSQDGGARMPGGVQMVGRLEGCLTHDVIGDCVVFAGYVLDLDDFDPDGGDVTGRINGVIVAAGTTSNDA